MTLAAHNAREHAAGATPDTCAVIVAGGLGLRFGAPEGKQYVELCGLPVLCWSLKALSQAPSVSSAVVVCAPDRFDEVQSEVISRVSCPVPVLLASSGATRQESVFSGLRTAVAFGEKNPGACELVAVHDAARPLITSNLVEEVIARVRTTCEVAGAIPAAPCTDTLKIVNGTTIVSTPDRSTLWAAQTPQVFRIRDLFTAHERAAAKGFVGTDDASLMEVEGARVEVVAATQPNVKITLPGDLAIAEQVLIARQQQEISASQVEGERV